MEKLIQYYLLESLEAHRFYNDNIELLCTYLHKRVQYVLYTGYPRIRVVKFTRSVYVEKLPENII